MDVQKKSYFMAVKKMLAVLFEAGKGVVELTPLDLEVNEKTLQEFRNEVGVQYEYSIIHRGLVRVRKKA